MFEWPWNKAKRERKEREDAQRRAAAANRWPMTSGSYNPQRDSGLGNAALYYALYGQPVNYPSQTSPAVSNPTSSAEPDRYQSDDYGTRDHTGFKTGGGFGGEDNTFSNGGGFGGSSSYDSSSSSSSDSSSYSSSDSGSSSDGGGGGGGGD